MKKFVLAAIAAVMILSSTAFASTKTVDANSDKINVGSSVVPITLQSDNPGGW